MMKNKITDLKPKRLWYYFDQITQIPRQSKHEEKILKYLIDFAREHNLEFEHDQTGNIVIRKPASPGHKSNRTVVLQSHVDMVCEKNEDVAFNFDTDAIKTYVDDGWVKAEGTTLGADDGIGMAAELALLESKDIAHPALECLFTVDEETGLTGAFKLSSDFLKGDMLINLDSEDDGQVFIGCAGGVDTTIKLPFTKETPPANFKAFKLKLAGLRGGHSGDDIQKKYGNANKLVTRIMWMAQEPYQMRFSSIDGGSAHNAIAREASAIVLIPEDQTNEFQKFINEMESVIRKEYHVTEPRLSVILEDADVPNQVISLADQKKLLNALYACPHGVIAWSQDIENFVETSTNLAVVKTKEDHFFILNSHRSSVESAKEDVKNQVAALFQLTGANISHGDGYPGWQPNPDSEIVKTTAVSYKNLFREEPEVRAIHAGLECGLIGKKYPEMDMVSIGPEITGAHSPDEAIEIKSVEKFWEWVLDILKNIQ
jgi:dipeptidase D